MEVKTAGLIALGLSKVKKSSTELSLSEDLFFETLATFEIKIYIHRHQIVVRSYLTFGMLSYGEKAEVNLVAIQKLWHLSPRRFLLLFLDFKLRLEQKQRKRRRKQICMLQY